MFVILKQIENKSQLSPIFNPDFISSLTLLVLFEFI